ncbi:MAG: hypothetical protein EOM21_13665 [Gammaproteobacteria bacterium]|nr:hypothetical protein [Gammaproteobacteria bacterium]
MIPGNALSTSLAVAPVIPPDDLFDWCRPRTDWEFGGVAVGDPTQGFQVYHWRVRAQGTDAVLDVPDQPSIEPVTLFTSTYSIAEIGLSFDQNMNPSIAYYENGRAKFWYFNTDTSQREILLLPEGSISPRCFMDDKRPTQTGSSDILLLYLRDGALYYRQQRDRYLTERWLRDTPDAIGIARCGMTYGKRVQIELVYASDYLIVEFCSFIDLDSANPGQWYESNEITLNEWVTPESEITVTGGEYRYKWNQFAEWTEWTTAPGVAEPGGILQLRGQAVNGFESVRTVRVMIGDFQCAWSITTIPECEDGNPLIFTDLVQRNLETEYTSEIVTLTVCSLYDSAVTITGGTYKLNDADWTSAPGTADPGDTIQLKVLSSDQYLTTVTAEIVVGQYTGTFSVTTRAETGCAEYTRLPYDAADASWAGESTYQRLPHDDADAQVCEEDV